MGGSPRLWRGVSFVHATLWAWLMMVVGFLAVLEFAGRYPASGVVFRVIGVVLVSMGLFIAGVTADRWFTGANPWVTGSFELAAWAAATGVIVLAVMGVLL
ncbi:MAG: hypothetical protein KF745_03935 [Phycisphaeraceae bacterium]|nr:hypothetical protein [Phycisphaeraceae bacterium]